MSERPIRNLLATRRAARVRAATSIWLLALLLLPVTLASPLIAQHTAGRGAISAQDLQRLVAGPLPPIAGAQLCPHLPVGSTVTAPADLQSVNGVLEVTLSLETDVDAAGRQRFCYLTPAGQVAPTLRVSPGDVLLIHFHNDLPAALNPVVPHTMPGMIMTAHTLAAGLATTMHPSTTPAADAPCDGGSMTAAVSNLHFHGLNVSPTCHSDEVVNTLVQPGGAFDYNIQIPSNEPAGLYWYHPHPHGFSEGQVQGGATGAIIVSGIEQANHTLAGLPEQVFVLRDLLVPTSEQAAANVPAWDVSLNNVPINFPGYTPAVVPVAPGRQQLWRVLNSAADTIFNLQYNVAGTAQTLTVVAVDGVPVAGGSYAATSFLLPPGSRAEFVVTTPALGQIAQLVTNYVNTGPDGDSDPNRPLANIVASAAVPATPVLPALRAGVTHAIPRRFTAMEQATPIAQRTLYFSEQLENPTDPNSPTTFFITQNGFTPKAYTMGQAANIVVHSGTVEDWVIENHALEDHIFHIHQIHFQVMAVNGVPVNDPAIRDTYDLPYWTGQGPYPSITVRVDFRDPNIVGTFVYHCHILQHEDSGMMGAIEVLAPGAASTAVVSSATASLTPNTSATLKTVVSSAVAGGSTPTGQVQFQNNGIDLGSPVTLVNGVAALSVSGASLADGANAVQAFYLGDALYAESLSTATPITNAPFALSGAAVTAPIGTAAVAPLTLAIATGFTDAVAFTCAMPAPLTQAACFVNPSSVVGGGPLSLTVNTTPAHPSSKVIHASRLLSVGLTAMGALLLPCIGLTRRRPHLLSLFLALTLASFLTSTGCSSAGSASAENPGTPAGTYSITITATDPATSYTVSTVVPVTVH